MANYFAKFDLFQFSDQHLLAALLAFIPALVNLGIVIYINRNLPRTRTTELFTYTLYAMLCWQLTDTATRLSASKATATHWTYILSLGYLAVPCLALHFALLFSSLNKWLRNRWVILLIYVPFTCLWAEYISREVQLNYQHEVFWGWVSHPRPDTLDLWRRIWISLLVFLAALVFFFEASNSANSLDKKRASLIMALGILIPTILGSFAEIFLPLINENRGIPVTSSFMTIFSLATIIALKKFKSFIITDHVSVATVMGSITSFVFIISPDKKLLFINPHALKTLGFKTNDPQAWLKIMGSDAKAKKRFEDLVFEPCMVGIEVQDFEQDIQCAGGKIFSVVLNSKCIVNNGKLQGVMIVATDISTRRIAERKLQRNEVEVRHFAIQLNSELENERSEIAWKLNEEFSQQLTGVKMTLSSLRGSFLDAPVPNAPVMELINSAISEVAGTVRSLNKIATGLRPGVLDTLGLVSSIEWLCEEFKKKHNIELNYDLDIPEIEFNRKAETCIFRICQESLTNISKHAQATTVYVEMRLENKILVLRLSDNGKGFDIESIQNQKSGGLLGMRERTKMICGELVVNSSPAGTNIELKTETF